jgi:phage terminase Nu1 subunit (DNA packaging protein)
MIVTRMQLAEIVGVDARQVTRWLSEGMPADAGGKRGRARQIDTAVAIGWLLKRASGNTTLGPLADAREKLVRAKAQLAEVQAQIAMGEVYPAEDVQILFNEAAIMYVNAVESLPGRFAGALLNKSNPAEIHRHVADEVRSIRTRLADKFQAIADLGKRKEKAAQRKRAAVKKKPRRRPTP